MPDAIQLREYHAVFTRNQHSSDSGQAPQFTLVIRAFNGADALLQAKQHEEFLQGKFVFARLIEPDAISGG